LGFTERLAPPSASLSLTMAELEDTLASLPYRQLQRLAKEIGVKANQPKAKLLEALKNAKSSATVKSPIKTKSPPKGLVESKGEPTEKPVARAVHTPGSSVSGSTKPDRFAPKRSHSATKTMTPITRTSGMTSSSYSTPRVTPKKTPQSPEKRFANNVKPSKLSWSKDKSPLRAKFVGSPGSVRKAKVEPLYKRATIASAKKVATTSNGNKEDEEDKAITMIPKFVSRRPPNFAKLHTQVRVKFVRETAYATAYCTRCPSLSLLCKM